MLCKRGGSPGLSQLQPRNDKINLKTSDLAKFDIILA